MIDISRYINKLYYLNEYMWYWIICQDVFRKRIEYFKTTGIMPYSTEPFYSFDEWLELFANKY